MSFALIGAAGFVAPRHMRAIADSGNELVAAVDPHDSVGVIDSYFPEAAFFTEFESFDKYLHMLMRKGKGVNFVSICSPNYLHDTHILHTLRIRADAICEKPLVLTPWDVAAIEEMEEEYGHRVWSILQLRLNPKIGSLKKRIENALIRNPDLVYDIDLTYITSRGRWYFTSWKGSLDKSGGITANIGVHFFDMLTWIFGPVEDNKVHVCSHDAAAGFLILKNARVKWFLSINSDHLPGEAVKNGLKIFRSISIDGEEFEFSDGFTDLHSKSYEEILAGRGFGLNEAVRSIRIIYDIQNASPTGVCGDSHPLCSKVES